MESQRIWLFCRINFSGERISFSNKLLDDPDYLPLSEICYRGARCFPSEDGITVAVYVVPKNFGMDVPMFVTTLSKCKTKEEGDKYVEGFNAALELFPNTDNKKPVIVKK